MRLSLPSGGIRLMKILEGLRSNWASNDSGVTKSVFVVSGAYNLRTFRAEAKITIRRHLVYPLSSERKNN